MVVIVNTTSDKSITENIRSRLAEKGIDATIFEGSEMKIGNCIGCNYCWLKDPGVCTVKDDHEKILSAAAHADQVWFISDTALGFVDHKCKNVIDRLIPLATMYLYFKGDQMRHVLRYDKAADMGLIVTGDAEMEFLKRWNERVALNLGSGSLGVFKSDELKEAVTCMH